MDPDPGSGVAEEALSLALFESRARLKAVSGVCLVRQRIFQKILIRVRQRCSDRRCK